MKKIKNKLFYLYSFVIYLFLVVIVSFVASKYLDIPVNSYLINKFVATGRGSDNIVEIVIDDTSIQDYKLPWSRERYADLLDFFHTYSKPKVVGLDMVLKTYDPNNPADVLYLNQLSKMNNLVTGFIPEQSYSDEDAEILKKFKKDFSLDVELKRASYPVNFPSVMNYSYDVEYIKNLASVIIQPEETSGTVFSAINILKIGDSFYPSLALKLYLLANNTNKIVLDNKYIIIPKTGLKIPYTLDSKGIAKTNIRYYRNIKINNSSYSHPPISASKILHSYYAMNSGVTPKNHPELFDLYKGKYLNPEFFNDKIVIIGQNISGPTADIQKTPISANHPGVDIQASSYDNIANSNFLSYSNFGVLAFSVFIMCLITFLLVLKCKFFKGILSIISLDFVYLFFVIIFAILGHILPCAIPFAVQLVTVIFGYSFKFLSENRNKEKIKQAMGKYLSQDIMNNVVSNIDDLKLGGKRAIVTVLFSDIRGFTSLSEKMSAEEVSMILNEYFAEMEPIITKYNGVINKFIGDAVMAIFGEPIQDINHARNAVKCAYEMLKKVEYLREKWLFEGKPKIEIGVGINTGEVFIGNIGTETRMEYTVIGDTVNLASRIESYNKVYKTNLLVSSSTYAHIADIADVIKISEVQIRGKAKKMNIYEVLRIDRDKEK